MKRMFVLGALAASLLAAVPAEANVTTIKPYASKTLPSKITGMSVVGLHQYVSRVVPLVRFTGGVHKGKMCWGPPRSDGCSAAVSGRRVTNLIGYRSA